MPEKAEVRHTLRERRAQERSELVPETVAGMNRRFKAEATNSPEQHDRFARNRQFVSQQSG
jgi:hypothetical protein